MRHSVCLIDDDELVLGSVAFTLMDNGFDVLPASNGAAGLAILQKYPVDVVITDVNMPGMDGIAVIRKVRPDNPEIPIIATTGAAERNGESIANLVYAAGATRMIVKPFKPSQLLRLLQEVALRELHPTEETKKNA